jgi:cytochrome c biogenesis protein CcmG/thiol:disulfide interchange protein DsbE
VTPPRAILLAAVVLAAASCTGDAPGATGTTPATNAAMASSLPTMVDALPTMDPEGFTQLLGELRGTPLVVNFWASWCTPCNAEAPRLVAAHARYGHRVQFLGVDILDARDDGGRFLHSHGITYPSVFDGTASIEHSLGLVGQPVTAFFDAEGTLVANVPGEISSEDLDRNVRAIAHGTPSS